MIVKKIRNGKIEKPKSWQIGDLVDYIRFPHNKNPQEKIEYAGGRNFLSSTHTGQKAEMIALARESVHSAMPVQHWIFSWREGEQPTREQVEEVVDMFLEKMELAAHQIIYGLHHDTDNYHLHIAVNRMNPESGKVVQPHRGFDIREAHKILAFIEHKQGWAVSKMLCMRCWRTVNLCGGAYGAEKENQNSLLWILNMPPARNPPSASRGNADTAS